MIYGFVAVDRKNDPVVSGKLKASEVVAAPDVLLLHRASGKHTLFHRVANGRDGKFRYVESVVLEVRE